MQRAVSVFYRRISHRFEQRRGISKPRCACADVLNTRALTLLSCCQPRIEVNNPARRSPVTTSRATLVGRQVAAVINFPPRQIGKFMSEVLTLGFPDENGEVVSFSPDRAVQNGARLF
jgi:hypothetical protein